jgi:hypothetical protein
VPATPQLLLYSTLRVSQCTSAEESMAPKKKTTFAKLNRERKLVEKRMAKQAKKLARKEAATKQAATPANNPATSDRVSD